MFGTPDANAYHNETHVQWAGVCKSCDGAEAYAEAVAQNGPWF
jgi:hypothetical protein